MGIPLIDRQHRDLMEMTNWLSAACPEGQEEAGHFLDKAQGTVDALRQHFNTEEQLMLLLNYADFAAHKTAHTDCAAMLFKQITSFEQGEIPAADALVHDLREWLIAHFAEHDKLLTGYVKRLRRKGKLEDVLRQMPAHSA
jgi:hemerythrin-like metal-binding protein